MKNEKSIENWGIYIYPEISSLIYSSNILNTFSKSRLINYCLSKQLPEIFKELQIKDSDIFKFADLQKRKADRFLILPLRSDKKRKFYFFKEFLNDIKKLLQLPYTTEKMKKKRILEIMDLYINESKTYEDNHEITNAILKYKNAFEKTKTDTKDLAILLDIKIIENQTQTEDKEYLDKIKKLNEVVKNESNKS